MELQMLSVIIPAYNEVVNISICIQETMRALEGMPYEIIVVDDGSQDATRAVAIAATGENSQLRVVGYNHNQGKGYALKSGFPFTSGDLVAFIDGDMQIHPRQIRELLEIMKTTGADVVVGCKRHAQSQHSQQWVLVVDPLLFRSKSQRYADRAQALPAGGAGTCLAASADQTFCF
jgi:glycosyltransferase involved in cell wall biosynthesis